MTLPQVCILSIISLCCTLSVYSNDISYNYWDVGVSLSDKDSDYLSDDLNFYGDIDISKNLYEKLLPENLFGVHFWVDLTQSRNLSEDSVYKLTLLQSAAGIGVHYSTESFSTYFRLGKGGSSAKFKTTSQSSSSPFMTGGGGDIFAPPISIFNKDRPQSETTYTNKENGTVGKIGIRYRLFEKYQIGAAAQCSNMKSFGTELSTYIQKDFENFPGSGGSSFNQLGCGYLSIKAEATTDKQASSIGSEHGLRDNFLVTF